MFNCLLITQSKAHKALLDGMSVFAYKPYAKDKQGRTVYTFCVTGVDDGVHTSLANPEVLHLLIEDYNMNDKITLDLSDEATTDKNSATNRALQVLKNENVIAFPTGG